MNDRVRYYGQPLHVTASIRLIAIPSSLKSTTRCQGNSGLGNSGQGIVPADSMTQGPPAAGRFHYNHRSLLLAAAVRSCPGCRVQIRQVVVVIMVV